MAVTLSDLRTQLYALLREEPNSSAYPYTLVDSMINSAQLRICSGKIVNTFNNLSLTKGALPFLEKRVFYQDVQSTSLASDAVVGGVTLTVADTTNFLTAGFLWIEGDIVEYTGITPTTFTGCTGIDYAHLSGVQVYPAYEMPEDYMSSIEVSYNNSIPIPFRASKQIYRDQVPLSKGYGNAINYSSTNPSATFWNWQPPFYTIWDGLYFVPFWINNSIGFFCHHYEKIPESLVDADDEATIPNDIYAKNCITYLAAGEVLFNRGEEARASTLLTFAYGQINEMYAHYNNIGAEDLDGQYVSSGKNYLNI